MINQSKTHTFATLLSFSLLVVVTSTFAGEASICKHFNGASATFSHSTDVPFNNSLYYGEACAFKFNIHATVYDSPVHVGPASPVLTERKKVSKTGRLEFGIYLQSQPGTVRNLLKLDKKATNITDEMKSAIFRRQVSWHKETYGFVPATCAYQAGTGMYDYMVFNYMLAGRSASPRGVYDYGYENLQAYAKHFKISSRAGDPGPTSGLKYTSMLLQTAIDQSGWYRDFIHWHTSPVNSELPTVHDFFQSVRDTIDKKGKQVACIGDGEAIQHKFLRDIAKVALSDDGKKLTVTYQVSDWMLKEWNPGFRPADSFRIPLFVKVNTRGTGLSGSDLKANGATVLRKVEKDVFILAVPFEGKSETVVVTLSASETSNYPNFDLPNITNISNSDGKWEVSTDQKTNLVVFSVPNNAGKTLATIKVKNATIHVGSPLRFNTMTNIHRFSLTDETTHDYYVGIITHQRQSILEKLVLKSSAH